MMTHHATNKRINDIIYNWFTWYDLVQKWPFCQWWCSHFKWSSYYDISIICGVWLIPKSRFHWLKSWKWTFKKTSVSCNGVNCQHVKLYGFNTLWESLIWFQQGISQTRATRKIAAGTNMQEGTLNMGNLSSKWRPLKWDLILINRLRGLIDNFPRLTDLFEQRFVWVLTAFIRFWYTYICFDPNYGTVVVASIQMLLAQRI